MNGAYTQWIKQRGCGRVSTVIEKAAAKHAEACQIRRAKAMNAKTNLNGKLK